MAVALSALGVLVAEILEALHLYRFGDGPGASHRWPANPRFGRFLMASAIRMLLGGLVVASLMALGMVCNETVAFLAGFSTLKVTETYFGHRTSG
ncbi:MAG TPA: hypothetical protein VG318_03705 [Actinomycetota bacterium]|nr:hypothetical protein [Actinomycetota bacterium]